MKTPLAELTEEFELLKSKAPSLKDQIYLDGVLAVIDSFKAKEKVFMGWLAIEFAEWCIDHYEDERLSFEEQFVVFMNKTK